MSALRERHAERPAAGGAHCKPETMLLPEYAAKRGAKQLRLCVRHKRLDGSCKATAVHAPCAAACGEAALCERKCKGNAPLRSGG